MLTNPYRSIPEELRVRLNADIPLQTRDYLRSICPTQGALYVAVNLFIKSIHDELKHNGITEYNPDAFEQCVIRRTAPRDTGENDVQHVRRGASSVRPATPPTVGETPGAKGVPGNVRGKSGK